MKVNVRKTKVMVVRKSGLLSMNLLFEYNGETVEIVSAFSYLGIVLTAGGSFNQTQITLAGQSRKAIYKIIKYIYNFTNISITHRLELFDKLVLPILNYGCEVGVFHTANILSVFIHSIAKTF